jgi:hypothetical protein
MVASLSKKETTIAAVAVRCYADNFRASTLDEQAVLGKVGITRTSA